MPRPRRRALTALAVTALSSLTLIASSLGSGTAQADPPDRPGPSPVKLQILALNDFHGQLEKVPATSSSGRIVTGRDANGNEVRVPAGGAEYLATHLKELRAEAAQKRMHSVTVAAGDLIGATPLLSAAFHDEPTIEAMNEMGLQISSVGNHEFDEGWQELVRMQRGGCLDDGPTGANNQNSCPDHTFEGADFQYLSANVTHTDTGRTVFPAVKVERYDGIEVGFVGMTLEDTPNIVTKAGVEGLTFSDEAETANAVADRLHRQGVDAVVVLLHEGGFPADPTAYNSCPGISGPIVDIERQLSPRIDAVITGHTHQAYNCEFRDRDGQKRLVTSGSSIGRLVTEIDLDLDRRTGDVVRDSEKADNHVVTNDATVTPDAAITSLISVYKKLVEPIAGKVIGHLANGATSVTRTADDSGESPLGNLIADAQRADQSTVTGGKVPEIAFMNPGGIRADLQAAGGSVTYGDAFSVQPFNNYDVSMDMTGAQVLTLLNQQGTGTNAASRKILQVSGVTYSYHDSPFAVVPESVQVNGEPLDPARTYRVVANSFLSDGGDGFPAFTQATNKFFGGVDIDAFAAYLSAHDPYTPTATDRITKLP
ncbi:MAG: bifunctional metallophosphatase/5'-nucleotidase [Nocardioidaceae bacterium]|nr:bifunctional metallophosphatase/5'-nucleotidase [Nocardioidaceae bacterium]NUS50807.1 bifunctional metallophosphatase/5'-nucleotidase [Nocardioidaceae bacterium]